MNIKIINKLVSKNLNIEESKVELINTFYWKNIKTHITAHEVININIPYIGVFELNQHLLKNNIKNVLHYLKNNKKDSKIKDKYITRFRKLWKLRKELKSTC